MRSRFPGRALCALLLLSAAGSTVRSDANSPLRLPLRAEPLAAAEGAPPLPTYEAIELTRRTDGHYDARLVPGDDAPPLSGVDLTLLVPRLPRLAKGSEPLTRLAFIQREFNRNEVHHPLPGGLDFSIANNCLERGLWEVKLARTDAGKTTTLFHGWFTFPKEEYARLFAEANGGASESAYDGLFAKYPGVGGFVLPLDDLRSVRGENVLPGVDTHARDALDRLTEQKGKVKLVRTAGLETYGDVVAPTRQPVTLAKFNAPGLYDPSESMRFDLTWLAKPPRVTWRRVSSARRPGTFPELELAFDNGYRIIAADAKLSDLPARAAAPQVEADVLRLVCGIGTPVIHATEAERVAELSEDRPRYLLLLDGKGNHVDNHLTGVDGLYAWREAGTPGKLHVWLVSYERIALIAHYSAAWPAW